MKWISCGGMHLAITDPLSCLKHKLSIVPLWAPDGTKGNAFFLLMSLAALHLLAGTCAARRCRIFHIEAWVSGVLVWDPGGIGCCRTLAIPSTPCLCWDLHRPMLHVKYKLVQVLTRQQGNSWHLVPPCWVPLWVPHRLGLHQEAWVSIGPSVEAQDADNSLGFMPPWASLPGPALLNASLWSMVSVGPNACPGREVCGAAGSLGPMPSCWDLHGLSPLMETCPWRSWGESP